MTNQDKELAMRAVNDFMYFSWNYTMTKHEYKDIMGEVHRVTVPRFLVEADWHCNFQHILGKWNSCVTDFKGGERDSYSFLPRFYSELDGTNRRALIDWMLNNYHTEIGL